MGANLKSSGEGLKRIAALAAELKVKPVIRIGVLSGGPSDDELSQAELAAIHEFGAPRAGIPERSFLRATADLKRVEWMALFERALRLVVAGRLTLDQAMGLVGQQAVADIVARIREGAGIPPPLKPATIAAKGSDRPLVDTGRLVQAISYEVKKGGPK